MCRFIQFLDVPRHYIYALLSPSIFSLAEIETLKIIKNFKMIEDSRIFNGFIYQRQI